MDCLYNLTLAQQTNTTAGSIFNKLGYSQSQTTVKEDITTLLNNQQTILDNLALIRSDISALSTSINSKIDNNQAQLVASLTNCIKTVNNISNTMFDNHNVIRSDIMNVKSSSEMAVNQIQEHRTGDVITITDRINEVRTAAQDNAIKLQQIRDNDVPALASAIDSTSLNNIAAVTAAQNVITNVLSSDDADFLEILTKVRNLHFNFAESDIRQIFTDAYNEGQAALWDEINDEISAAWEEAGVTFQPGQEPTLPVPSPRPLPPIPALPKIIETIVRLIADGRLINAADFALDLFDTYLDVRDLLERVAKKPTNENLRAWLNCMGLDSHTEMGFRQDDNTDIVWQRVLKNNGFKEQVRVKDGKPDWGALLKMKTLDGQEYYLTQVIADTLGNFYVYTVKNNTL